MRFRSYYLLLPLALLAVSCHRGDGSWEAFRKACPGKDVTIRIHPWMKWGLGAASALSHDPETAALVAIAKRMKAVEIHFLSPGTGPSPEDVDRLGSRLHSSGYASFVSVRSAGTRVNLWARAGTGEDELRDPLVLIRDPDGMVLVEITGALRTADLNRLLAATMSRGKD